MKLPHRRQFLHLAASAAALPAVSRMAGASLSVAAGALIVGFRAGGAARHHRAPDGSMAIGAARPAIRHREPAGRWQQHRHRGGRAGAPDGYTLLLVDVGECHQRDALRQAQLRFHPRHRAGRGHRSLATTSWRSIRRFRPRRLPSSSPMPRPIRARSTWRRPATGPRTHVAGELFKMMAGVDMRPRAVSRRTALRSPICSAGRCRSCSVTMPSSIEYIRAGKLRALGRDDGDALGGAAGRASRRRNLAGLRGERLVRRRRAQEHAR